MKEFHIPLAQRKLICARLKFFQAAYPDRLKILLAGAESEFDQVRDNVFRLTEQSLSSSPNSIPLDEYLRSLLDDLHQQMGPQLKGHYGALFQPVYDNFQRHVNGISCAQCSSLSPRICDGGSKDDEIVREGGLCIAPIRSMFDLAAKSATNNYSQWCNFLRNGTVRQLTFSTSFINGKPHDIPGDYFVGAATTYRTQPNATAEVELTVWPKKFDFNTYAATQYVLFHECICHAYQDVAPSRSVTLKDGFIEGWMDWISFECFRRELQSQPSSAAFVDAGMAFYLLRADYNHKDRSDQASVRAFGRSIAQRLEQLLKRLPESAPDPWERFLTLSFDLNVTGGLGEAELAVLDGLLLESGEDQPDVETLVEALRKYFNSNKIKDFLSLFV